MNSNTKLKSCKHSKECGSCCDLELEYEAHLNHKMERLTETLKEFHTEIFPCVPSPKQREYRLKVQLPFGKERERKQTRITLGCFAPGTHKVVDQDECHIQDPGLNEIARLVKAWAQSKHIPVYNELSGSGVLRYLLLRKSKSYGEVLIGLVCAQELRNPRDLGDELYAFIKAHRTQNHNIKGIVVDLNSGEGNRVLSGNEHLIWGTASFREKIGDLDFELGLSTFFQINTYQIPQLYNTLLDAVPKGAKVIELFSGTGSISLWVAAKAQSVLGIEINRSSVLSAQRSATLNGVNNVRFECGDASRSIGYHPLGAYDCLIVDPPRRGLGIEILSALKEHPVDRVIYVSCNPDSLKKDLLQLQELYRIQEVHPVDMFPYTPHLETIAILSKR